MSQLGFSPKKLKEVLEEGTYLGQLIRVVELGIETSDQFIDQRTGEPVKQSKVNLTFELTDNLMIDKRPFVVSGTFTASLNEKARLRPIVETLLSRKVTEEDASNGSETLKSILGKLALVQVKHTKNGNAAVQAVVPVPKGSKLGKPHNSVVFFDLSLPDLSVFNSLPKFIQDQIQKNNPGLV